MLGRALSFGSEKYADKGALNNLTISFRVKQFRHIEHQAIQILS
jgi:hypothetical protein